MGSIDYGSAAFEPAAFEPAAFESAAPVPGGGPRGEFKPDLGLIAPVRAFCRKARARRRRAMTISLNVALVVAFIVFAAVFLTIRWRAAKRRRTKGRAGRGGRGGRGLSRRGRVVSE